MEDHVRNVQNAMEQEQKMVNNFGRKLKLYLASGWFSPAQDVQLTKLEKVFDDRSDLFELFSPRRAFICPPDAHQDVQNATFDGNIAHIRNADFVLVNTSFKDVGTIWEAGASYAYGKKNVYFCEGLPKGAKFNLMLAKSGIKVCTSFEQLEDYLKRCHDAGTLLYEPYDKEIE
jgi:nucleoside 2-deoxyribosyltransferase